MRDHAQPATQDVGEEVDKAKAAAEQEYEYRDRGGGATGGEPQSGQAERRGATQRRRASLQLAASSTRRAKSPKAPAARPIARPKSTVTTVTSRTSNDGTKLAAARAIAPSTTPNTIRSSRLSSTPER